MCAHKAQPHMYTQLHALSHCVMVTLIAAE